jgi:hypothetical protein
VVIIMCFAENSTSECTASMFQVVVWGWIAVVISASLVVVCE